MYIPGFLGNSSGDLTLVDILIPSLIVKSYKLYKNHIKIIKNYI